MNVLEARTKEFPQLEEMAFLDAACVSFPPKRSVDALVDFTYYCARNDESSSSAHHIAMDSRRQKAYLEAAKLLNADLDEIALVESTTHALNIAATSLPLKAGDKVLTTSLEFLQVAIPWCMMRETHGIEVIEVPGRDGRFEVQDFAELVDEKVKLIVTSSVEWCNGWMIDIKALGEFCKEKGIYLVVDAIQHVGVYKIDVKELHVDMLTAGGHKWLNSPFGTGILYIRKDLIPTIKPAFYGYLNLKDPEGGWGNYFGTPSIKATNDWEFPDTARKFEIGGTCNYLGAIALGESLSLVNEIGIENIQKHVFSLTEYAMKGLKELGATLVTHEDPEHRSGIVIFRLYDTLEEEQEVLAEIHRHKVFVAMRFTNQIGGLRISCQYYNNESDLDKLFAVLKDIIGKKKPNYVKK